MTPDVRPGLNSRRLVRLMSAAVDRCGLDLSGRTVLTEAANGAYVVTPVLAAMAGADVYALAAETAYASADEIEQGTIGLAKMAEVAERIHLIYSKDASYVGAADIITNSGQVRPIDAKMVAGMKPSAVVSLMYESWEFRPSDVDLEACRDRGITVAGTNERHPDVDVFSFLGPMAMKQIQDAGVAVRGSRILVLCDNHFAPFILKDLKAGGADVTLASRMTAEALIPLCDVVLLALLPGEQPVLTATDSRMLAAHAPGVVLVQYWGDADRAALAAAGVAVWPEEAPGPGHMGILPSALGPDPIVRLQAGGLKVGELLARGVGNISPGDLTRIQVL